MFGDINNDGVLGISDVTALFDMLLSGATIDIEVADLNGDQDVNISDVTALIDLLLK